MGNLTPAQEYGATLGSMKRGMETMMRQILEGFKLGYSPESALTPEQLEQRRELKRERLYQMRINHERDLGRAFVRNEVRRVRRELGLDPNDLA